MGTVTSVGSGNWATGGTWDSGSRAGNSDDVVIASGHNVTISQGEQANSLTVASGGTLTASGERTITIDSENGSGFAVDIDGAISGDVNLTITTPATTSVDMTASSGKVHDLIINHASCVVNAETTVDITGDLTITAGTFNTNNNVLTVAGDVSVTGTLTGNESAISMNSLTIESAGTYSATNQTTTLSGEKDYWCLDVKDGGTFTHNNGMVLVTTNTNTIIRGMEGDDTAGAGANALNRLQVELGGSSYRLELDPVSGTSHTIKGNVTIAEGSFYPDDHAHTLTIEGDVSIESGGTLGHADRTGADTFGSLTIASGGTAIATSGTTTITGETASHAWKNDESDGTGFVHNNGLVHFDYIGDATSGSINVKENVFYDLEISLYATTYSCSLYDGDGSNAVTILNNLDVTKGEVEFSTASDTITIHGLTNITANAKFSDNASHDTNKIIHNGLVTNLGTYNINDGTTVKLNGGIRQLGTLTVK